MLLTLASNCQTNVIFMEECVSGIMKLFITTPQVISLFPSSSFPSICFQAIDFLYFISMTPIFIKMGKLTSLEGSTPRLFSLCNDQGIFCINFRKLSVSAFLEVLQLLRTQKNKLSLIKSCCFHPPQRSSLDLGSKYIGHIQNQLRATGWFKWPHVSPSKKST